MLKFYEFLKKQPIVTAALALALVILSSLYIPQSEYAAKCLLRLFMCGAMLYVLYMISGEKAMLCCSNRTGCVLKWLLPLLITALLVGLLGVVAQLEEGVRPGVLPRTLLVFCMFLAACLFEEIFFRGVLNDAIVYQFRSCKGVFVISAVVTSLVFGAIHLVGSPLNGGLAWAQAGMKTLSGGLMGFILLVLYWKTRNLWALGLGHGLYDFFASLQLILGGKAELGAGTYVKTGAAGAAGIGVMAVQAAITGIIALVIWKKVGRTIDFEEMRKNW